MAKYKEVFKVFIAYSKIYLYTYKKDKTEGVKMPKTNEFKHRIISYPQTGIKKTVECVTYTDGNFYIWESLVQQKALPSIKHIFNNNFQQINGLESITKSILLEEIQEYMEHQALRTLLEDSDTATSVQDFFQYLSYLNRQMRIDERDLSLSFDLGTYTLTIGVGADLENYMIANGHNLGDYTEKSTKNSSLILNFGVAEWAGVAGIISCIIDFINLLKGTSASRNILEADAYVENEEQGAIAQIEVQNPTTQWELIGKVLKDKELSEDAKVNIINVIAEINRNNN